MANEFSETTPRDNTWAQECVTEARSRLASTAFEFALGKKRGRDLLRYCYTATYPPLSALHDRKTKAPIKSHPGGWTRVYVHFPFCSGRCSFCHFNISLARDSTTSEYVRCLERELGMMVDGSEQFKCREIYFGGGTPSLMSATEIGGLIARIRAGIEVDPACTITLEMHPETVNRKFLGELWGRGVNRISIGVQDFDNSVLSGTIRRHSRDQAMDAIAAIRHFRFDFNIDLLAPLPGQTDSSWIETLRTAFSLDPNSVTLYTTSVRETMPVKKKLASALDLRNETRSMLMHAMAQAVADRHGYEEATSRVFKKKAESAPAMIARECTTEAIQPELGIGCGAYGLFGGLAYHNVPQVREYMRRIKAGESPALRARKITSTELTHRGAVMAVRAGAVDLGILRWLAGTTAFARLDKRFNQLVAAGLASRQGDTLLLNEEGRIVSDELSTLFVSASVRRELRTKPEGKANRFLEHLNHFYDLA